MMHLNKHLVFAIAIIFSANSVIAQELAQQRFVACVRACSADIADITLRYGNKHNIYKATLYNGPQENSQSIGYIKYVINTEKKSGKIDELFVQAEWRKHRLGSVLVEYAKDDLRSLGCKIILLRASPFTAATEAERKQLLPNLVSFYQRHNFKVIKSSLNDDTAKEMRLDI